jgi:hypothetical protein
MDELKRRAYCKWHNSFSHATNGCNVFCRQIHSCINDGRIAFQEMQVDTQSFPINTIEPISKKVLVRPKMADKGKGKSIVISGPRMSNISQGVIVRKDPNKKTNKSGGTGGQAQLSSQARLPDSSIADCPTPARGWSGAHTDGLIDSDGQFIHGQRRQPPHKAKTGTEWQSTYDAHGWLVKADPTFDQLLSKFASKKAILRDRPTKKPRSPAKIKWKNKTTRKVRQQASPIHTEGIC